MTYDDAVQLTRASVWYPRRMSEAETVSPKDRAAWRRWLAKHHTRPTGVWLLVKKKGSAAPGVSYEEAVEEALCFG